MQRHEFWLTLTIFLIPVSAANSPSGNQSALAREDSLQIFRDFHATLPLALQGDFGGGLFSFPNEPVNSELKWDTGVFNDSRGLTDGGQLPEGANAFQMQLRPLALGLFHNGADVIHDHLVLEGSSHNGWSDSIGLWATRGGYHGFGLLEKKSLPPGKYADVMLVMEAFPDKFYRGIAMVRRIDSSYFLDLYNFRTLQPGCSLEQCLEARPDTSVLLKGSPASVTIGKFDRDDYPDIAVGLAGHPGRIQVLLVHSESLKNLTEKLLTARGDMDLPDSTEPSRLGLTRTLAVGNYRDSLWRYDSLPDLLAITRRISQGSQEWLVEGFRHFTGDSSPESRILKSTPHRDGLRMGIQFDDIDGDKIPDYHEWMAYRDNQAYPGTCCLSQPYRVEIRVQTLRPDGILPEARVMSTVTQRPLGLTVFPQDSIRYPTPLMALALAHDESPANQAKPNSSGIFLFRYDSLVSQGIVSLGVLRGGPLAHMHSIPQVSDMGDRLVYTAQVEPPHSGASGYGHIHVPTLLKFLQTAVPSPLLKGSKSSRTHRRAARLKPWTVSGRNLNALQLEPRSPR